MAYFNIADATFSQSISTQDTTPTGMTWNNDGSKMYEVGAGSDKIYEYNVAPSPTSNLTGISTLTGVSSITF